MNKYKCLLMILLSAFWMTGCSSGISIDEETVPSYIASDYGSDGKFSVWIKNGDTETRKSFRLKADVSYDYFDYENNVLFAYGPGGLVKADGNTGQAELVCDKGTSHVFKNGESYARIEDYGPVEEGYKTVLYPDVEKEDQVILPYPVLQVEYCQGSIWITNQTHITANYKSPCLFQYSPKGELMNCFKLDRSSGIQAVDDQLYFIRTDGIYKAEDKILDCRPYSNFDTLLLVNGSICDLYKDLNTDDLVCNEELIQSQCMWFHQVSDTSFCTRLDDGFYIIDLKEGMKVPVSESISESLSRFYRIYPIQCH